MQFLGANENLPFTIALAVMALLGCAQVITLLLGSFDIFHHDADLDADGSAAGSADGGADLAEPHSSIGHAFVYSILGWLQFGKLPTMVVFILLLMTFGIGGLLFQKTVRFWTGSMLPAGLAGIPVTILSVFFTGIIGRGLAR